MGVMALFSTSLFAKSLTCDEQIEATFKNLKTHAVSIVKARGKNPKYMLEVELRIVDDLNKAVGTADAISQKLEISRTLCSEDPGYMKGVVAHELGHFVSFAIYEDFKRSVHYNHRTVTNWKYEWVANEIGAQLFLFAGMDKSGLLAVADTECSKNKTYFCDKATAWRTGSFH